MAMKFLIMHLKPMCRDGCLSILHRKIFRTMEDASATDLDWFWRGWFYSTDVVDIGVKNVKRFYFSDIPDEKASNRLKFGYDLNNLPDMVFKIDQESDMFDSDLANENAITGSQILGDYLTEEGIDPNTKSPKYFYEIEFEKPGGLVMPLIVEYNYADGTSERASYPVQIWRKNNSSVKKVIASDKRVG